MTDRKKTPPTQRTSPSSITSYERNPSPTFTVRAIIEAPSPLLLSATVHNVGRGSWGVIFADLLHGQLEESEGAQNNDDGEDDIIDDDASDFSSQSIVEASVTDIYDNLDDCPDNNPGSNNDNLHSENR